MNVARYLAVCVCVGLLAGCRDGPLSGGRICSTEAKAGIQVDVRDAVTGNPAARGAVAIAADHSFVDTLRMWPGPDSLTVVGAFERPGVYAVIITKEGYRDWVRLNVVVGKDECHVITVRITALLEQL